MPQSSDGRAGSAAVLSVVSSHPQSSPSHSGTQLEPALSLSGTIFNMPGVPIGFELGLQQGGPPCCHLGLLMYW